MTVKELRDFCDWYIRHDPSDHGFYRDDVEVNAENLADYQTYRKECAKRESERVMFCDDKMKPEYSDVVALGSVYSREVKPAVVEMRYEIDSETGEIDYSKPPVPVQITPPEYQQEDILMLIPD